LWVVVGQQFGFNQPVELIVLKVFFMGAIALALVFPVFEITDLILVKPIVSAIY